MKKKQLEKITEVWAPVGIGVGMTVFVSSLAVMGVDQYRDAVTSATLHSDIMNIATEIEGNYTIAGPQSDSLPLEKLHPGKYETSNKHTTVKVVGTMKSGYCVIGVNPTINGGEKPFIYSTYGVPKKNADIGDCKASLEDATTVVQGEPAKDEIPYQTVGIYGLGGGVGIGALVAGSFLFDSSQRKKIANSKSPEVGVIEPPKKKSFSDMLPAKKNPQVKMLIEKVSIIKSDWASYEMDIAKLLEYPSVTNLSIPATADFYKALKNVDHIIDFKVLKTDDEITAFRHAVLDLDHKFDVMISEAKRTKWNGYTNKEQDSLRMAKNLLALALNSSSTANERQIAYKRLIKEVEGIIVLPEKTMLQLEIKVAPGITTGDFNIMKTNSEKQPEKV